MWHMIMRTSSRFCTVNALYLTIGKRLQGPGSQQDVKYGSDFPAPTEKFAYLLNNLRIPRHDLKWGSKGSYATLKFLVTELTSAGELALQGPVSNIVCLFGAVLTLYKRFNKPLYFALHLSELKRDDKMRTVFLTALKTAAECEGVFARPELVGLLAEYQRTLQLHSKEFWARASIVPVERWEPDVAARLVHAALNAEAVESLSEPNTDLSPWMNRLFVTHAAQFPIAKLWSTVWQLSKLKMLEGHVLLAAQTEVSRRADQMTQFELGYTLMSFFAQGENLGCAEYAVKLRLLQLVKCVCQTQHTEKVTDQELCETNFAFDRDFIQLAPMLLACTHVTLDCFSDEAFVAAVLELIQVAELRLASVREAQNSPGKDALTRAVRIVERIRKDHACFRVHATPEADAGSNTDSESDSDSETPELTAHRWSAQSLSNRFL